MLQLSYFAPWEVSVQALEWDGTRLRYWRQKRKMTRDALALAVGCSASAIQALEAGKRAPTFNLAMRLLAVLHPGRLTYGLKQLCLAGEEFLGPPPKVKKAPTRAERFVHAGTGLGDLGASRRRVPEGKQIRPDVYVPRQPGGFEE